MSETLLTPDEERKLLKWGAEIEPMYHGAPQYGDIVLETGPNGADLKLKSGVANLGQQLTGAIATALGADPLNMSYGFAGFKVLSEETNPVMRREKLRFAILEVLQSDQRIQKVERILIGPEIQTFYSGSASGSGTSGASATPDAANRSLQVEAQFTIHSGATVTLALAPMSGGLL